MCVHSPIPGGILCMLAGGGGVCVQNYLEL